MIELEGLHRTKMIELEGLHRTKMIELEGLHRTKMIELEGLEVKQAWLSLLLAQECVSLSKAVCLL